MNKGRVLCIDDDEQLCEVLIHYLEEAGYDVNSANSVAMAERALREKDYDAVLIDLTLPDGEGLSLISQVKAQSEAGIIVVSGKDETTEKVVCLEMGADDYLTKPFEMRELSARIKAVARRRVATEASQPSQKTDKTPQVEALSFADGWTIDRDAWQMLDSKDEPIDLTTGEFALLDHLVRSAGKAVSREALFARTRDGEYDAYDRAIDIQIGRLRKKIEAHGGDADKIKTVRGVGYMYISKPNS